MIPVRYCVRHYCELAFFRMYPAYPAGHLTPVEEEEQPCSRCLPYNHELRRGHRAPDALAAAAAKRRFVRATPYRVTTAPQAVDESSDGQLPVVRCHSRCRPSQLFTAAEVNCRRGLVSGFCGSVGVAGTVQDAATDGAVLSLGERFDAMRQTEAERLTCGEAAVLVCSAKSTGCGTILQPLRGKCPRSL